MKKEKLKRLLEIIPAFDKRSDIPTKNFGIGSCRLFFTVRGRKGAVGVNFFTNWYLPSTIKEYKEGIHLNQICGGKELFKTKVDLMATSKPIWAASWDIHSKKKRYKGQKPIKNCQFVGGKGICYSDGSCLGAERYLQILFEKGSDGVFNSLEKDYFRELK